MFNTADIIYVGVSTLITLLFSANIYFVKGFFTRMEKSVAALVAALEDSKTATSKLSTKLTLLDYQVAELNRIVKDGSMDDEMASRDPI